MTRTKCVVAEAKIAADDAEALERLARYPLRSPLSLSRVPTTIRFGRIDFGPGGWPHPAGRGESGDLGVYYGAAVSRLRLHDLVVALTGFPDNIVTPRSIIE